MSAYEQRVEPPDKKWQYLLFAAEPYETISFKVSTPPWNPPDKSGSICCLLLNHMKQYHSRWAPPMEPSDKSGSICCLLLNHMKQYYSRWAPPMEPPDKKWQYLLFAVEPCETISFEVSTPPWNPLIKSDSICCLLLNHMRQYHSRWAPPHGTPDKKWQYLLFVAEPYETISFKVSTPHGTPW